MYMHPNFYLMVLYTVSLCKNIKKEMGQPLASSSLCISCVIDRNYKNCNVILCFQKICKHSFYFGCKAKHAVMPTWLLPVLFDEFNQGIWVCDLSVGIHGKQVLVILLFTYLPANSIHRYQRLFFSCVKHTVEKYPHMYTV